MRLSKVNIRRQGNYIITCPQSPLTDSEFSQFHDTIVKNIYDEKAVKGIVIDLKNMDVIDSFATRILHDIADSTTKREVPIVLCNIHSDILRVMEIQGLDLIGIDKSDDLKGGLKLLDKRSE